MSSPVETTSDRKVTEIVVRAFWDEEANVWVARTSDIEGLAAEAETVDELLQNVVAAIEDLLDFGTMRGDGPDIPVHLMTERTTVIRNPDRNG